MENAQKRKLRNWLLGTLGTLALLFIFGNTIVERLIVQKIENNKELPFAVSFKNIEFSFLTMQVGMDSLTLQTDEVDEVQFTFFTTHAKLSGWNWFAFLTGQEFKAELFRLENPQFVLYRSTAEEEKDTTTRSKHASLIDLKSIYLAKIEVTNGSARIHEQGQDSAAVVLDSFYTTINDYNQLRQAGLDSFWMEKAKLRASRWRYRTGDQRYILEAKDMLAEIADKTLIVGEFQVIPRHSKADFSKIIGEQKGRLELTVSDVEVHQFDFVQLFQKRIVLNRLRVPKAHLVVNEDKSVPHREQQEKDLPHWALKKFGWKIRVDTIQVEDTYVRYEQYNPTTNATGYVDFQQSYLSFYHLTNVDSLIQQKPFAEVDILTQLMGKGELNAHFKFDLPSTSYSYTGTLGRMDLPSTNVASVPLAALRIESGQVHEITFDIQATNEAATGTLQFSYEDLKITLLEKTNPGKKGLASFLANTFAVEKNNPQGKNFRIGKVYASRDKTRSIFNHIWSALRSGLRSTVMPDMLLQEELKHK